MGLEGLQALMREFGRGSIPKQNLYIPNNNLQSVKKNLQYAENWSEIYWFIGEPE